MPAVAERRRSGATVLADTSVWIDHLRGGDPQLEALLVAGRVIMHPFIVGELACGNLADRTRTLATLDALPQVTQVRTVEVRHALESRRLHGRGIKLIDAHLFLSAMLEADARFWTRDRRLHVVAEEAELAWPPPWSSR